MHPYWRRIDIFSSFRNQRSLLFPLRARALYPPRRLSNYRRLSLLRPPRRFSKCQFQAQRRYCLWPSIELSGPKLIPAAVKEPVPSALPGADGRVITPPSLNGFNLFWSGFCCVFFSCNLSEFGAEFFFGCTGSACLSCPAELFAFASGARVLGELGPLSGSKGAVG